MGDLVNKGPKSFETVRFVREQGFYSVRGNHDDSTLAAYYRVGRYRGDGPLPAAYAYVEKFNEADVRWLTELPYSLSIPHLRALVVHAGVVPGLPLESQTAAHMTRIRSVLHKEVGGVLFFEHSDGVLGWIGGGVDWSGIASVESHTTHTRLRSFVDVSSCWTGGPAWVRGRGLHQAGER